MRQALENALSYFPRKLPVGMKEFDNWSDRIIRISGKFADEDSMKFALASQLMHLPPQASSRPDQYFVRSLRKAAVNQVASQVFQDIKVKQQEAAKKAAEEAEATAKTQQVASNEPQQS